MLGYAKFQPDRYSVIVDKLTTSRWIRKYRPQLMGFLVPPELLRSLPAIVGEQPGVLFLDDMSSLIWDEATRVVRHFNFDNDLVKEWKPGDDDYDSILDLFVTWGGVFVKVPDHWKVINETNVLMGGISDKSRVPPPDASDTLILRGLVIQGGLEITN